MLILVDSQLIIKFNMIKVQVTGSSLLEQQTTSLHTMRTPTISKLEYFINSRLCLGMILVTVIFGLTPSVFGPPLSLVE
jgi:hypothetical protein